MPLAVLHNYWFFKLCVACIFFRFTFPALVTSACLPACIFGMPTPQMKNLCTEESCADSAVYNRPHYLSTCPMYEVSCFCTTFYCMTFWFSGMSTFVSIRFLRLHTIQTLRNHYTSCLPVIQSTLHSFFSVHTLSHHCTCHAYSVSCVSLKFVIFSRPQYWRSWVEFYKKHREESDILNISRN